MRSILELKENILFDQPIQFEIAAWEIMSIEMLILPGNLETSQFLNNRKLI